MDFHLRPFAPAYTAHVIDLWNAAGLTRPWNDPVIDIERAHTTWPENFLVATDTPGHIAGTVMSGFDGHRGWLYYLAVTPEYRGNGLGSKLVHEAERRLAAQGCVKVQLMVRSDNATALGFYDALGYERSDVIVAGKRLDG
jgi:ribosomal protein S18 acetylase RimI-like enzyme